MLIRFLSVADKESLVAFCVDLPPPILRWAPGRGDSVV